MSPPHPAQDPLPARKAPDTHPADPTAGRVLLIHFPLAPARPGRQGAGRGGRKRAPRAREDRPAP